MFGFDSRGSRHDRQYDRPLREVVLHSDTSTLQMIALLIKKLGGKVEVTAADLEAMPPEQAIVREDSASAPGFTLTLHEPTPKPLAPIDFIRAEAQATCGRIQNTPAGPADCSYRGRLEGGPCRARAWLKEHDPDLKKEPTFPRSTPIPATTVGRR